MNPENFSGDRYSIRPERPDAKPAVSEEGVVTGEIGRIELPDPENQALERLRAIEAEAKKDALLGGIFEESADAVAAVRAGRILDRIAVIRRELENSDADEAFKRARARWLSDIANRLRELL